MEERVTSKLLPGIMANFIVWIDDKPKEGKAIFEKIILPEETTIFEQLQSTAELSRWLNRHARLFTDASANVLFVTNMTRKEEKGLNEQAGIEGVRLIRQVSKTVPIFFYIGNIEANRKKLTDSKVSLDRILIGNQPAQVEAFLSTNIAASVWWALLISIGRYVYRMLWVWLWCLSAIITVGLNAGGKKVKIKEEQK